MLTGKPEHLKTFDYVGIHQYFLTFCTHKRGMLFVARDRVDLVYAQFLRAAADERVAVLAYCFMPDHLHVLVEGLHVDSDC